MADCNCRGGANCCMLQQRVETPAVSTGTVIIVYLRTEDERQIDAIAEAVADTLDIAAGRPKTPDDAVPYVVTVGSTEIPEDAEEFVKVVGKGKRIIICPRPILDDNP